MTLTLPVPRRLRPGRKPAKVLPATDVAWDASRLRAAWDQADPDPTQIAARIGVTTETLRRWRRGLFVPNALELRALARELGAAWESLLPPDA